MKKKIAAVLSIFFILAAISAGSPVGNAASAPGKSRSYYEQKGDIIWEVPSKHKWIALTFDDGPDPHYTPQILDLLKQYHAHATFFVIGEHVREYPELVQREAREGNEIANHTYHHDDMGHSPIVKIREEIRQTNQAISEVTGVKPHLFRPPGGVYNDKIVAAARENHSQVILWSWHQDTKDWRKPGVGRIVNQVVGNARNGDIILLHDHVNGSSQTVAALKQILPALEQEGYQFVTVSELIGQELPYFN